MRKLTLRLDALQVETFETTRPRDPRTGTVRGHGSSEDPIQCGIIASNPCWSASCTCFFADPCGSDTCVTAETCPGGGAGCPPAANDPTV